MDRLPLSLHYFLQGQVVLPQQYYPMQIYLVELQIPEPLSLTDNNVP